MTSGLKLGRPARDAGPSVAGRLWAGAFAEGGILWLTGRSVLFLGVLLGWLALR